jgi:hypothetical protein
MGHISDCRSGLGLQTPRRPAPPVLGSFPGTRRCLALGGFLTTFPLPIYVTIFGMGPRSQGREGMAGWDISPIVGLVWGFKPPEGQLRQCWGHSPAPGPLPRPPVFLPLSIPFFILPSLGWSLDLGAGREWRDGTYLGL